MNLNFALLWSHFYESHPGTPIWENLVFQFQFFHYISYTTHTLLFVFIYCSCWVFLIIFLCVTAAWILKMQKEIRYTNVIYVSIELTALSG